MSVMEKVPTEVRTIDLDETIAVLEEALDNAAKDALQVQAYMGATACNCKQCQPDPNHEPLLRRGEPMVDLPEPAVLVAALEQAAAFVADPYSPKVRRAFAVSSTNCTTQPCAPNAAQWCAIGYLAKVLGTNDAARLSDTLGQVYGVPMSHVWMSFDKGFDEQCCDTLRRIAGVVAGS